MSPVQTTKKEEMEEEVVYTVSKTKKVKKEIKFKKGTVLDKMNRRINKLENENRDLKEMVFESPTRKVLERVWKDEDDERWDSYL